MFVYMIRIIVHATLRSSETILFCFYPKNFYELELEGQEMGVESNIKKRLIHI